MTRWQQRDEWAKEVAKELPNICESPDKLSYVPVGWQEIVYAALIKIEAIAEAEGIEISIAQIKEKYGGLRLYMHSNCHEGVEKIVEQAEASCWHTCARCGNPGSIRTNIAWYETLCDTHYMDEKKRIPSGGLNKNGNKKS